MELKCNISLVDRLYRRTALHIAAESNPEMIPFLLEAGLKGLGTAMNGWIFRGVKQGLNLGGWFQK